MKKILRWKKDKPETGLARIGAGPRSSSLTDGEKVYARVIASGGDWRGKLQGWFWVCGTNVFGEYMNTCNDLATDEATAKAQAIEFVKARINKALV